MAGPVMGRLAMLAQDEVHRIAVTKVFENTKKHPKSYKKANKMMKKASKMRPRTHLEALPMQNQLRTAQADPAPSPRQRFGLDFRGQNPTKIYKNSIKFYIKF